MERKALKETSRMVVKFGTGILTSRSKQIDPGQIEQLVAQVAAQRQAGREIIVVSSGAVGAGLGVVAVGKGPALGLTRPRARRLSASPTATSAPR